MGDLVKIFKIGEEALKKLFRASSRFKGAVAAAAAGDGGSDDEEMPDQSRDPLRYDPEGVPEDQDKAKLLTQKDGEGPWRPINRMLRPDTELPMEYNSEMAQQFMGARVDVAFYPAERHDLPMGAAQPSWPTHTSITNKNSKAPNKTRQKDATYDVQLMFCFRSPCALRQEYPDPPDRIDGVPNSEYQVILKGIQSQTREVDKRVVRFKSARRKYSPMLRNPTYRLAWWRQFPGTPIGQSSMDEADANETQFSVPPQKTLTQLVNHSSAKWASKQWPTAENGYAPRPGICHLILFQLDWFNAETPVGAHSTEVTMALTTGGLRKSGEHHFVRRFFDDTTDAQRRPSATMGHVHKHTRDYASRRLFHLRNSYDSEVTGPRQPEYPARLSTNCTYAKCDVLAIWGLQAAATPPHLVWWEKKAAPEEEEARTGVQQLWSTRCCAWCPPEAWADAVRDSEYGMHAGETTLSYTVNVVGLRLTSKSTELQRNAQTTRPAAGQPTGKARRVDATGCLRWAKPLSGLRNPAEPLTPLEQVRLRLRFATSDHGQSWTCEISDDPQRGVRGNPCAVFRHPKAIEEGMHPDMKPLPIPWPSGVPSNHIVWWNDAFANVLKTKKLRTSSDYLHKGGEKEGAYKKTLLEPTATALSELPLFHSVNAPPSSRAEPKTNGQIIKDPVSQDEQEALAEREGKRRIEGARRRSNEQSEARRLSRMDQETPEAARLRVLSKKRNLDESAQAKELRENERRTAQEQERQEREEQQREERQEREEQQEQKRQEREEQEEQERQEREEQQEQKRQEREAQEERERQELEEQEEIDERARQANQARAELDRQRRKALAEEDRQRRDALAEEERLRRAALAAKESERRELERQESERRELEEEEARRSTVFTGQPGPSSSSSDADLNRDDPMTGGPSGSEPGPSAGGSTMWLVGGEPRAENEVVIFNLDGSVAWNNVVMEGVQFFTYMSDLGVGSMASEPTYSSEDKGWWFRGRFFLNGNLDGPEWTYDDVTWADVDALIRDDALWIDANLMSPYPSSISGDERSGMPMRLMD
ncbi:MAG: hypothetical protein ACKVI4_13530 [Actinomycetales bacterium]